MVTGPLSHALAAGADWTRNRHVSGVIRPADLTLAPEPVHDQALAPLRATRRRRADCHGVRDLLHFGSTARGEAADTSRVDLSVEFDPDRITLSSFLDFIDELEALFRRRVDVVSLLKLTPRLRAQGDAEALRVA